VSLFRSWCVYFAIFLRSAQRFFIASDSRFRPAGVMPPRFFLFVALPLGLPTRFLLPGDKADPTSAPMARPKLSRSFFKSETTFARSKVRSLLFLVQHVFGQPLGLANGLTCTCLESQFFQMRTIMSI
jgi:hypothetical protein